VGAPPGFGELADGRHIIAPVRGIFDQLMP
jgi:hypothetical protein